MFEFKLVPTLKLIRKLLHRIIPYSNHTFATIFDFVNNFVILNFLFLQLMCMTTRFHRDNLYLNPFYCEKWFSTVFHFEYE